MDHQRRKAYIKSQLLVIGWVAISHSYSFLCPIEALDNPKTCFWALLLFHTFHPILFISLIGPTTEALTFLDRQGPTISGQHAESVREPTEIERDNHSHLRRVSREPQKQVGAGEESKMMNVFALGILASTLAAAGIWSPSPHQAHEEHENNVVLILKEGRRAIVVEYERECVQKPTADSSAGATPPPPPPPKNLEIPHGLFEEAKEKFKEAAADLPNLGQGVSGPVVGGSKEKICDAFGRCKEKISVIYSKAKELVSDGVPRAGVGKEAVGSVMHGGEAVVEKAKDGMKNAAHGGEAVVEKTKEAAENFVRGGEAVVEKAKETARNVIHGGEKAVDKAKEAAGSVIHGGERVAENVAGKAKHGGEKVAEKLKSFAEEAEHAKEKTCEEAKQVEEMAEEAMEESKHGFEEPKVTRVGLARDTERRKVMDAAAVCRAIMPVMFSPETSRLLMWVVHLLSFSITYGVCIWITFVSSDILGRVLPRQQFAVVQSKIYPVYFRAVACGIGCSVLSFFFSREHGRRRGHGLAETLLCYNLLASLGLVLVNMLYLEPRATKVMYEKLKLEKEEGKGRDIDDMVAAAEPGVTTAARRKISDGSAAGNGGVNATTFSAAATAAAGSTAQQEAVKLRAVKLRKRLKKINTNSSFLNVMNLMSLTWHLVYLAKILHTAC
ncbi:hypothetical protein ACLOJK_033263 [Asimina triloba]